MFSVTRIEPTKDNRFLVVINGQNHILSENYINMNEYQKITKGMANASLLNILKEGMICVVE